MSSRTKPSRENLMQGADAEQLTKGIAPDPLTGEGDARNIEEFDPVDALKSMGILGLPQPVELPEPVTQESDVTSGTGAIHDVREYGSGVTIPANDELVIGHGVGIALPDRSDESLFTESNVMAPVRSVLDDYAVRYDGPNPTLEADPYAEERAAQQDRPTAMRFNEGKARWDLLPPDALAGIVDIYTMGAKKYADRNWEKGLSLTQCFASMMRHAWKWMDGEDLDQESGLHHMDHAAWNAIAISAFFKRGRTDLDDRPGK